MVHQGFPGKLWPSQTTTPHPGLPPQPRGTRDAGVGKERECTRFRITTTHHPCPTNLGPGCFQALQDSIQSFVPSSWRPTLAEQVTRRGILNQTWDAVIMNTSLLKKSFKATGMHVCFSFNNDVEKNVTFLSFSSLEI